MKKFFSVIVAIIILLGTVNVSVYALETKIQSNYIGMQLGNSKAVYNDKYIDIDSEKSSPKMEDTRTMVPVRFVSEKLMAKVDWIDSEKKIIITKNDTSLEFNLGSNTAIKTTKIEKDISGGIETGEEEPGTRPVIITETVFIDAPPRMINTRTFVPLRLIAETFGFFVYWDDVTHIIIISEAEIAQNILAQLFKDVAAKIIIKAASVTLNKTSATLEVKKILQLSATVNPSDTTNKAVKWNSNNNNIATVSANGLVTAIGVGNAVITVTITDGSNKSASCAITVKPLVPDKPDLSKPVPPAGIKLSAPLIYQNPELPTGCEITAATMLINCYGYNQSKINMMNKMPKQGFEVYKGRTYGADLNVAFAGDPKSSYGVAVNLSPIKQTIDGIINKEKHKTYNITGVSYEDLKKYLANGYPVLVWASMGMTSAGNTISWYIKRNGVYTNEIQKYVQGEHCLVLIGFDKNGDPIFNDPQKGQVTYKAANFKSAYERYGKQAMIILGNR